MRYILTIVALAEMATGLALLAVPGVVGVALIGAALEETAAMVARLAGVALIGLGVACWPGPARNGMILYNLGAGILLGWYAVTGAASGLLIWPAVIAHFLFTVTLLLQP